MRFLAFIGALAILGAICAWRSISSAASTASPKTSIIQRSSTGRWRASAALRSRAHATDAPPANLDDAETVKAGAKVYSTIGCVNCHGGPPDAELGQVVGGA